MVKKQSRSLSKWKRAAIIVVGLFIVSYLLSIIISNFVDDDLHAGGANVALIEISGPIFAEGGSGFFPGNVASSAELTKVIRRVAKRDSIKAVVFVINSPGGSAVASDEIAAEIKKLNKTTVAWIREVGASGAYWIASSTDHIVANRMTITGSIGVIASYLGFYGLMDDHNVTYERYVAGNLKDLGTPFKEPTPEEERVFQKSLDAIHDYFIDEIAENRGMSKRRVKELATGQFYLGVEAYRLGLVDELGGRDEVLAYVEEQIGERPKLTTYSTDRSFLDALSNLMQEPFYYTGLGIGSALTKEPRADYQIQITT